MGAKRARPAERKREAYRKRQNLGYSAVDVDFATALPSLPELFPELRCRETDNTHSWLHNCRIDPLVVSRTCLICKIDYATASSTPAQLLAPTSNVLELAQTLTHGSVALLSEADQLAEAYVVLGPPATQAEWHQFVEAAKGKSVIMLIGTAFEWSLDKGVMLEWDNSSAGSEGCQTSKRTANCRPFNADLYHQRLASAVGLHWLNVYEQHGLTPELLRKPWMYSQDLAQQDDHDRIVMARERLGDCLKDCDLDDAVDAPLHCHPKLLKALIEAVCLILAAGQNPGKDIFNHMLSAAQKAQRLLRRLRFDPTDRLCTICGVVVSTYGLPDGQPTRCSAHLEDGMVDLISAMCVSCGKARVRYSFPDKAPTHCTTCKEPGMQLRKMCYCGRVGPSFAMPGQPASHCAVCQEDGMVNVSSHKCKCGRAQPIFGIPGESAQCCAACQSEGMQDIVNKRCQCERVANSTYGFKGGPPICCAGCKEEGMVVVVRRCECGRAQPSFGKPGETPKWCKDCRDRATTVERRTRKCGCGTIACYGAKGALPSHCAGCKQPGMFDIRNKKCHVCGKVKPNYGLPLHPATHCVGCKEIGMVDVNSPKCRKCGKKQPTFGFPTEKAVCCKGCKEEGMKDLKNKKCVCGEATPNFAKLGEKAARCKICKLPGMVNVNALRAAASKQKKAAITQCT